MRIFLDDLEMALQAFSGKEKMDITDESQWAFINENLGKYLLENVKLWDEKNKEYQLIYVGAEMEDDVMWCYLEVERVKSLDKVKFQNKVLLEVWGDQENLVHFRAFDDVKSARLSRGEGSVVFEWKGYS